MLNSIILFLLLFGSWIVLSGFLKPLFIFLGVSSCLLATFISYKMTLKNVKHGSLLGTTLRAPSYILWLLKQVVSSSLDVTVKMWQIDPDISPEIAWVSTNMKGDMGLTLYGNSITLTPGTVTTDVRQEGMLQVHALSISDMKGLRSGEMNQKVINLVRDGGGA